MEALQYIYTSWKNGNSTEKGYMIYSRSEGISEAECTAIKTAMQYLAPKELNLSPTQEEINDVFPYSFSYFQLPTGRGCLAQSTYLGKDYSGRFGNYIIYALVFENKDLPCRAAEMFGESYIKTYMTEEELEAPSPVPPLPAITITEYGSVINDEQLSEFLYDKEAEFAQLIAFVLAAKDAGIPFYLNDTRENLVLWAAAMQRIFPKSLAKKFTFNTYVGDHESVRSLKAKELGLDFYLVGVRPDANYFNYATEYRSSRQVVMDFLGGHMTEGIEPDKYCQAMASSITMDYEEIEAFGEFLESIAYDEIDGELKTAYQIYRWLRFDEFEYAEETFLAVLQFAQKYCSESDRSDLGCKMIDKHQSEGRTLPIPIFLEFWKFVCKNASFMIYTVYDILQDMVYQLAEEASDESVEAGDFLKEIASITPAEYQEYKNYFNTSESVNQGILYLAGHTNIYTNLFYVQWILENYSMEQGLKSQHQVIKLLNTLLANICKLSADREKAMINVLFMVASNKRLFADILQLFMNAITDWTSLDKLCDEFAKASENAENDKVARFEKQLLNLSGAEGFAARLYARKIEKSKKPEEEFWRYHKQITSMNNGIVIPLDPLIAACMNVLPDASKEKTVLKILELIELDEIEDEKVLISLTDTLDACDIKNLSKMDMEFLLSAYRVRQKINQKGLDKTRAILLGKKLQDTNKKSRSFSNLAKEIGDFNVSLQRFDRSDYEAYKKLYFDEYLELVESSKDVALLMNVFYNEKYFSDFISDYVSIIKKKEKKEIKRHQNLVTWTCVYLIEEESDNVAAEKLYKPVQKYLKSFDQVELKDFKFLVLKYVPKAKCEQFFDDLEKKESFSEKIGGFFRRK